MTKKKEKTQLENVLMTAYKEEMIHFLNTHPEHFDEALHLAIKNKQPYSWRSAWLLYSCSETNDRRIIPLIDKIISSIPQKKDGHQRELLKVLSKMQLNEEQEGLLFTTCVDIWEKLGKSPSVRYTALNFLITTAEKYPVLANEILLYTQDHYIETLSPGVKNSVKRIAKKLSDKIERTK